MVNHFRTLLLNMPGEPASTEVGAHLIPIDYRSLPLPQFLRDVRRCLFGQDPDRLGLLVRGRQYLELVHSLELSEYVTTFDPRITYRTGQPEAEHFHRFGPLLTRQAGNGSAFLVVNDPGPETGRLLHSWVVRVLSGSTVEATRRTPPNISAVVDYTVDGNLSSLIPLPGGEFGVMVSPNIGARWYLEWKRRPLRSMTQVVRDLEQAGTAVTTLLGNANQQDEPWPTLRNLWRRHYDLPYRLAAIVVAYVHRMDELRIATTG